MHASITCATVERIESGRENHLGDKVASLAEQLADKCKQVCVLMCIHRYIHLGIPEDMVHVMKLQNSQNYGMHVHVCTYVCVYMYIPA
jgi:hypothetical protein